MVPNHSWAQLSDGRYAVGTLAGRDLRSRAQGVFIQHRNVVGATVDDVKIPAIGVQRDAVGLLSYGSRRELGIDGGIEKPEALC